MKTGIGEEARQRRHHVKFGKQVDVATRIKSELKSIQVKTGSQTHIVRFTFLNVAALVLRRAEQMM